MVLPHQGVFLWLDRSSAQSCHDAVGLIDEPHHLLALGTEFYEHHGRELGSMRACQRQSGMESPRFQNLYKVAPSRRLSTQKADTTEATNALGEIVFVKPNEHRQAFLELCPWRENEGWNPTILLSQMSIGKHFLSYAMARNESRNPMFSLIQMSIGKHFLSYAMARKRSQHEGWNLWSKWACAASRTIRWMTSAND